MKHSIGNLYKVSDTYYLLCGYLSPDKKEMVLLASLFDGNRYTEPIEVHDWWNISEKEFQQMVGHEAIVERIKDKSLIISDLVLNS